MSDIPETAVTDPENFDYSALGQLTDRVAIVTGAGQGIGRAFAHALAAYGATVVIADLNIVKAEQVAEEINSQGKKAIAIETDIGDFASLEKMAATVHQRFNRIDILINNAGIFSTLAMRPFWEIPLDEWSKVMHVNITGVMLSCKAVVPYMKEAKWGRIINMSSASILMGRPNYLHYTTSKAALIGMTRSMARELGDYHITVNAIMPGAVQTEIPRETVTPEQRAAIVARQCVPRSQVPQDLVGGVLFLASNGSEFMTGQTLNLDGGACHL